MSKPRKSKGWYTTFFALVIAACLAIPLITGQDAIGAAARFLWNAFALLFNAILRLVSSFLALLARGVGWRRLSRSLTMIGGVGLSYAGNLVLSDDGLAKAYTWQDKIRAIITRAKEKWDSLHLVAKLALVVAIVAVQLYLHFLLIIFPVAFLVPVVRRIWIQIADILFGSWYWRMFGAWHRTVVAFAGNLPGIGPLVGAIRLTRLRYLAAWRLWRHDPRYRDVATGRRQVDLIEPVRLWWLGELDCYVGRPLLAGARPTPG